MWALSVETRLIVSNQNIQTPNATTTYHHLALIHFSIPTNVYSRTQRSQRRIFGNKILLALSKWVSPAEYFILFNVFCRCQHNIITMILV